MDKLATALAFVALRFCRTRAWCSGAGAMFRLALPCGALLSAATLLLLCLSLLPGGPFPRLVGAPVPSDGLLRCPSRPPAPLRRAADGEERLARRNVHAVLAER